MVDAGDILQRDWVGCGKSEKKEKTDTESTEVTEKRRSRALGISWTPNCDENESEITRRCV
jgi:hypothetical protein